MKKEQFEIRAMDYLRDELPKEEKTTFEQYLEEHPKEQEAFEQLRTSWSLMGDIEWPGTSETMDERFFDFLNAQMEENKQQRTKWWHGLSSSFRMLLRPQLVYGLILLAAGLGMGYFLKPKDTEQINISQRVSSEETEEVRGKLVLTLLEQPSANKRLQGVSEASKIEKVNEQVMAALLQTLNNDPNVNVRLAAIESLVNYVDYPLVRQGLVQSIPNQESPMVQVTLANLMLALQEKKSIEPFRKLLKDEKLDNAVKERIENTIKSII